MNKGENKMYKVIMFAGILTVTGIYDATAENSSKPADNDSLSVVTKSSQDSVPDIKTGITRIIVAGTHKRDVMVTPRKETNSIGSSVSEVDRKEIEERSASTLVDALRYSPGIQLRMQGRKVKDFITFRNQASAEFAVDGIYQKDFSAVPTFFSTNDIEKIEIIRSSAILLNSLSGINGMINIIPREYDSASINGEVAYGENKTFTGRVSTGAKYGKVSYALASGFSSTDGPENKNAAEKTYNISGRLKYVANEKLLLQGNVFYFSGKREMEISDPQTTTYSQKDWQYDPVTALIANMQGLYRWNKANSTQMQLYMSSRQSTFHGAVLQGSGPKGKYKGNFSDEIDREYGATLTHALQPFKNNTVRIGLLYNRWNVPFGKLSYNGRKYETEDLSLAGVSEYKLGIVDCDAGVRFVKTHIIHSYINTKGKDYWQNVNPEMKCGINCRISDNISINLSGTYGYVKPDPGMIDTSKKEAVPLSDEKRTELDLGIVAVPVKVGKVSAGTFLMYQKNGINNYGLDSVLAGTSELPVLTGYNRDQYTAGVEAEFKSCELFRIVTLFTNISYCKTFTKYNSEFEKDTLKPELILNGGITLRKWNADIDIAAKHVSQYYSSSFMPAGVSMKVGGYNTFDVNCGYTIGERQKIRLFASVKNVLDRKYYTIAGYPDDGRFVKCGLQFNY